MSLLQRLSDMAIFAKVVETDSFTQAAVALQMSKGAVSKAIARLEQHLSVRLLQRTTRQLKLTAEGQAFLSYCQQVVRQADQAEHHLDELRDQPVGIIRISVAVTFGSTIIAPLLPELLQRYPKLQIELDLNDRLVDLVGEEIDVAIRFGKLPSSSLIARPLTRLPIVLVAAPSYLAAQGIPQHPDDLVKLVRKRSAQDKIKVDVDEEAWDAVFNMEVCFCFSESLFVLIDSIFLVCK